MFIREIKKKQPRTGKVYVYHRLAESVRTRKGPRQNLVLNLGCLDLPREQWKSLAKRIEEILGDRKCLWNLAPQLEGLAQEFVRRIKLRQAQSEVVTRPLSKSGQWETIDLNSVSHEEIRTVGAEAVGYWAFKQLDMPGVLRDLGFSERQVQISALLLIGRLIHPAGEQETLRWAQTESALDEVLGADFSSLGPGAVYRTCDELVRNRENIEARLAEREHSLVNPRGGLVLYDLSDTCLMGSASESRPVEARPSRRGHHVRPLLALALVLDEDGFPKANALLEGTPGEPATLEAILEAVHPLGQPYLHGGKPTVVIDAGVASLPNLALISERKWDYLCVNRTQSRVVPSGEPVAIHSATDYTFHGTRVEKDNEVFLYCESSSPHAREQVPRSRLQQRWEEGLAAIVAAMSRKGGVKRYDKVVEQLRNLHERCRSVACSYEVKVERTEGIATRLTWSIPDEQNHDMRFPGGYLIRSSRTDLDETRLWSLYNTLAMVEDNFRYPKQEQGLWGARRRLEGRLVVSICACHMLAAIRLRLRQAGIDHRWEIIRPRLAAQFRSAVSMNNRSGDRIMIRQTTEPESFHEQVYRALGINMKPLSMQKRTNKKSVVPKKNVGAALNPPCNEESAFQAPPVPSL